MRDNFEGSIVDLHRTIVAFFDLTEEDEALSPEILLSMYRHDLWRPLAHLMNHAKLDDLSLERSLLQKPSVELGTYKHDADDFQKHLTDVLIDTAAKTRSIYVDLKETAGPYSKIRYEARLDSCANMFLRLEYLATLESPSKIADILNSKLLHIKQDGYLALLRAYAKERRQASAE